LIILDKISCKFRSYCLFMWEKEKKICWIF